MNDLSNVLCIFASIRLCNAINTLLYLTIKEAILLYQLCPKTITGLDGCYERAVGV